MKPINFDDCNIVFAENQPEYLPLPAYRYEDGRVITCWKLTFKERLKVLFGTKIWLSQLTFNEKLQPQLPSIGRLFKEK